jgi:hypothetical protein
MLKIVFLVLMAGGIPVAAVKPGWADFSWPGEAKEKA